VPSDLHHYLDETIMPSAWYPEAEYERLLIALASVVSARDQLVDVWEHFGKTAAQRDLAGDQSLIRDDARVGSAGLYRRFIGNEVTSVGTLFLRTATLWSMYHDTGRLVVEPSASNERAVLLRLLDFKFPVRGMSEMQVHYLCEYARLVGIELTGRVLQTTAEGAALDTWEYTVPPTPEAIHSVAQLRKA
ncbi:MAG TPA: hypothetical protein VHZ95_02760, partial [Polyangiales bacterium]|nr:hypothetical protein [Polyangiales bacterium]